MGATTKAIAASEITMTSSSSSSSLVLLSCYSKPFPAILIPSLRLIVCHDKDDDDNGDDDDNNDDDGRTGNQANDPL